MFCNRFMIRRLCDNSGQSPKPYIKPVSGFRKYISNKFLQFIQSYERILEKRFPRTFKIYRVFTIGTKDFTRDSLQYFRISRELFGGKRVNEFNYKELLVYFQTPKDMLRVGPVLLVSALPFTQYIVFPLAYLLPKQLLSHHFWTIEQRQRFQIIDQKKRLYYYRPVFRHIQSKLSTVSLEDNLQDKCGVVLAKLGSGTHPSVEQILDIKHIFTTNPFGLQNLKSRHLVLTLNLFQYNYKNCIKFRFN